MSNGVDAVNELFTKDHGFGFSDFRTVSDVLSQKAKVQRHGPGTGPQDAEIDG